MVCLPNELMLNTRHYQYDFIFIDGDVRYKYYATRIVSKCLKRVEHRFVAVSDNFQMINYLQALELNDRHQKIQKFT